MSVEIFKRLGWFVLLCVVQVLVLNNIHLFGVATPMLYVWFPLTFHRNTPQWAALLWSFTQMMHNLFWNISTDDLYSFEQKIEILGADAAMIELITGGKPNFFHGQSALIAAAQAVCFIKLGNKEKALDMLEAAFDHADKYENRTDGEIFAPCWLCELDDKREYTGKSSPDTVYDTIYSIITDPDSRSSELLEGSERFEALMGKLREKTSK